MIERTVVILPTYNERDNLADTIERLRESVPDAHVLVVDDNSPDGTGELADEYAVRDGQIHVLHRIAKEGLGAAYLAGFAWALERDYSTVVECDADGSHHPEELPRLLAKLATHDMVIGSRWISGGRVVDWPKSRELLSRGGSLYARHLLALPQRDVTGGYRAFRASALRLIGLENIASLGYCFQIEMLWRAHRAGLRIAEVPITFTERRWGVSKMRGRIVIEAMARVTLWGIASVARDFARFGMVGAVGLVVDVALFNALLLWFTNAHVAGAPLIAKGISVLAAISTTWAGNRWWAFRDRRGQKVAREAFAFLGISVAGSMLALACLAVSHYLLGLTSPVADNISANVIGLAVGTAFRFAAVRSWLFVHPRDSTVLT